MKRKEVYATTGTRIRVRVFGGWDFGATTWRGRLRRPGLRARRAHGRRAGQGAGGKAPSFLIRALRDPDGANLDRVQVIKGWLDAKGETHERIYDVAVSDGGRSAATAAASSPSATP